MLIYGRCEHLHLGAWHCSSEAWDFDFGHASSTLNSLQHIWQSFTNGSMKVVQNTYKTKTYVSNTHFLTSLKKCSKTPTYMCHFKKSREWSIQYYRNILCPQGYFFFFFDKSMKDKASRRTALLYQSEDTHSPSCQQWRHQYYMLLFHEHIILDSYHVVLSPLYESWITKWGFFNVHWSCKPDVRYSLADFQRCSTSRDGQQLSNQALKITFLIRINWCRAVDWMGFLSICINKAEDCMTLLKYFL